MPSALSGKRKAAILLITIGSEASANIFKYLRDDEIEELTLELAHVTDVSPYQRESVLEEFYENALAQEYISQGGLQYAREVLEKALGESKAAEILTRLSATMQISPFDFLRKADPSQIINFVQNEHPQTIALILAYMPAAQSSQVLSSLGEELQTEVAMRLAIMDRTSPEVVRDIEDVLERKLSAVVNQDFTNVGGIKSLVDVLTQVDRGTEKTILESLEEQNPELADEVRKLMFVFEDIIKLDNRSIQLVLKEVDSKDLGLALKGSSQEVQQRVFRNMSQRAATMLREELEYMGPVRLRNVEEAQGKIVNIIRRLEEAGEIVLARAGEDQLIV